MNSENVEPHKFAKGQSGNPKGRPKGARNISTVLKEMLQQLAPDDVVNAKFVKEFCKGKKRITNADAVAARIYKEGVIDGEAWALKELSDRTEGKAPQTVEMEHSGSVELVTFEIKTRKIEE